MKISFLFIILVLFFCSSSRAQVTLPISRDEFQAGVKAELAKHEGGEYLYQHADGYHRLVDYLVKRKLGVPEQTEEKSSEMTLNADTSHSLDVSRTSNDEDETTVGINRTNKSTICIGANDVAMYNLGMPIYTSTDKGISWKTHRLPKPTTSGLLAVGDPIIATDDQGYFYYAYLGGEQSELTGNITVATSPDGIIWHSTTPINVNGTNEGFPDKEHMTIDCSPTSPYHGRVYVVWYEFYSFNGQAGQGLNVVWSDDRCKTWSKPTLLGEGDDFQEIKTNAHGDVLLSFTNAGDLGQELFVSTDGGKTFDERSIPVTNGLTYYPFNDEGRQSLKGPEGFRTFPYVTFDVDLSNNRIHLVYPNYEQTVDGPASVLYYTTSENNGIDWTQPQLIGLANPLHSSPGFDRFNPWVTVDQTTGEAYVLYYSSEQDPNNLFTAAYRVRLSDALTDYPESLHTTFDPTIVEATTANLAFIGDYNGSDAFDSVYVGSWTENRPNFTDGEVFAYVAFPKYPSGSSGVGHSIVVRSEKPWLSSPYPNPVKGSSIFLSYFLPHASQIKIELFDAGGEMISLLADKFLESGSYSEDFSVGKVAAGTYVIRMTSGDWQESRKVVVTP
ncbi:MAG: T9SS type A sorting domain-containing protein [Candidatus Kapaibacterium sp.]